MFIKKIIDEDSDVGEAVSQICQRCRPHIIINMGENPDDSKMEFEIYLPC